jgi:hypothetical protein
MDKGRHSNVTGVRSYGAANCSTDHSLIVTNEREINTDISDIKNG